MKNNGYLFFALPLFSLVLIFFCQGCMGGGADAALSEEEKAEFARAEQERHLTPEMLDRMSVAEYERYLERQRRYQDYQEKQRQLALDRKSTDNSRSDSLLKAGDSNPDIRDMSQPMLGNYGSVFPWKSDSGNRSSTLKERKSVFSF